MERLTTRLRTWFPNAPWARSLASQRGTAGLLLARRPTPVGYLVNHPAGLSGFHGDRLRLRSRIGRPLRPVRERPPDGAGAGGSRRGSGAGATVSEKLELAHGPIPAHGLRVGAGLDAGRAWTPSGSSRWAGTATPTGWWCRRSREPRFLPHLPAAQLASSPSSTPTAATEPSSRPPTMGTSRGSACTASWDASTTPAPELALRIGVYGHFAPLHWSAAVRRHHLPACGWRAKKPEPTPSYSFLL